MTHNYYQSTLPSAIRLLERSGLRPMVCDTRVPLSSCPVRCGMPAEPGNSPADYVLLPKTLVGSYPEMFIPVMGNSMIDAGYEDGDRLRVAFGMEPRDGDNVLACIDGECTVKTLFTDEDGQHWLVPRNDNYHAILLTADMDVRILGCVTGIEKNTPRTPARDCLRAIRRTKQDMTARQPLTEAQVDDVLRAVGPEIVLARQWYAVMRAMKDMQVPAAANSRTFCLRVRSVLPAHGHLPTVKELQRMAVQSFSKPVALWNAANAPVSGTRFEEYLSIARKTLVAMGR